MSSDKPAESSNKSFFSCCACGDKETQKEAMVDLNKKQPDLTPLSKIYHVNINEVQKANQVTSVTQHISYESDQKPVGKIYNPAPIYTGPIINQPAVLIKQEEKKEEIESKKIHNPLPVYIGPISNGLTI